MITLELCGGFAEQTVVLAGHQFVKGLISLTENDTGAIHNLQTYYQALPIGGEKHKAWIEKNGSTKNLQPDQEEENSGKGNDPTQQAEGVGGGSIEGPAGSTGVRSTGDGNGANRRALEDIITALHSLDHKNSENWTSMGLPSVSIVAKLTNNPNVNRAMIEEALPGFKRNKE
jgi:hypothetical protein